MITRFPMLSCPLSSKPPCWLFDENSFLNILITWIWSLAFSRLLYCQHIVNRFLGGMGEGSCNEKFALLIKQHCKFQNTTVRTACGAFLFPRLQSETDNSAPTFLMKLTWHSPFCTGGGHAGGMLCALWHLLCSAAYETADKKRTSTQLTSWITLLISKL